MSSFVTVGAIQSPTDFVQKLYVPTAMVAREQTLMVPLVTVFNDRSGVAPRVRSEYGTATINSINDYDDLASQAFTPVVGQTLTPGEVGAQFFVTDLRAESDSINNIMGDAAMELGAAMADKFDRDLLSTFSNLTGGTVGGAGTVLTWGHVGAMVTRLKAQKAPGPYYCVLHPYHWHQLAKAVTPATAAQTNAPDLQNEATRMYWVSRAMGVEFFVTSNISIDGSDDAKLAVFSRQAIGLDIRRAPRLEGQRNASRRGTEINLSAVYAYGVWRPAFGIQGTFDATAPSS